MPWGHDRPDLRIHRAARRNNKVTGRAIPIEISLGNRALFHRTIDRNRFREYIDSPDTRWMATRRPSARLQSRRPPLAAPISGGDCGCLSSVLSKFVRVCVDVLLWLATAAGAAGVLLHFSRLSARLPVLAASVAPYLMCFSVVGMVAFLGLRRWSGAGVALVVVVVAVWTQVPLYYGRTGDEDGRLVRVMQANLLFDGADPEAVADQVRERDIELLTVNELTPAAIGALGRAGLDRLLPYRYLSPARTAAGTGIWSRYPLSDTVEYDGYVLNQLSATVTIPDSGPVSVFAFHPVPPVYDIDVWADELSACRRSWRIRPRIAQRSPAAISTRHTITPNSGPCCPDVSTTPSSRQGRAIWSPIPPTSDGRHWWASTTYSSPEVVRSRSKPSIYQARTIAP